jgi:hypothetical protein
MNQSIEQPEIITLTEASRLLGYSLGYTYQVYHAWRGRGVRFLKSTANAHPRFYRKEILRMLEARK